MPQPNPCARAREPMQCYYLARGLLRFIRDFRVIAPIHYTLYVHHTLVHSHLDYRFNLRHMATREVAGQQLALCSFYPPVPAIDLVPFGPLPVSGVVSCVTCVMCLGDNPAPPTCRLSFFSLRLMPLPGEDHFSPSLQIAFSSCCIASAGVPLPYTQTLV